MVPVSNHLGILQFRLFLFTCDFPLINSWTVDRNKNYKYKIVQVNIFVFVRYIIILQRIDSNWSYYIDTRAIYMNARHIDVIAAKTLYEIYFIGIGGW